MTLKSWKWLLGPFSLNLKKSYSCLTNRVCWLLVYLITCRYFLLNMELSPDGVAQVRNELRMDSDLIRPRFVMVQSRYDSKPYTHPELDCWKSYKAPWAIKFNHHWCEKFALDTLTRVYSSAKYRLKNRTQHFMSGGNKLGTTCTYTVCQSEDKWLLQILMVCCGSVSCGKL